jgi:hypothetical protein
MKVKIFIYCLFSAFLCSGCSQLRLVAQINFPEGEKLPQAGETSGLQDSLKTKNYYVQNDSARARIDSSQVIAAASEREAESHSPIGARPKLIPFREKSKIVWTGHLLRWARLAEWLSAQSLARRPNPIIQAKNMGGPI